jgi:glycosyltransferase involved in cell wall biosynthesis
VSEIRRIVMLGTAFETRGGVAAVLEAYRAEGLFERWPVDYIATHCDGGRGAKLLAAVRGLRRFVALIARHRRVLVHVHCASRASFWRKCVFMALAHAMRCPVVFHLHGGGFARFYDNECGWLGRRVVRLALDRAACVVALSERWRAWLAQVTSNPNVVCLPNPVRAWPAQPPRGRRNVVLYLGRIEAAKGIGELLEALARLRESVPDVELVCAGAGAIEAARAQAEHLGIEDAVRFPGWLNAPQKWAWLRRAGVFALPSHAEGLPMGVLEAMAAGLPVVASAVGGIPDLLQDGVQGSLVAPGDARGLARALRCVLLDPRRAAALGAAGRETIRARYTPERVLAGLENVYAGLGLALREGSPVRARLRRVA